MAQTFIYAIHNTHKNEIKIGYATDPIKRLMCLQTGTTDKLEILFTFKGGLSLETDLHAKLERYRISGEWFKNNCEVISNLKEAFNHSLTPILPTTYKDLQIVSKAIENAIGDTRKARITVSEILKDTQGLDKKVVADSLVRLGWTKQTYKNGAVFYLKP